MSPALSVEAEDKVSREIRETYFFSFQIWFISYIWVLYVYVICFV
jgi:hypothetical protein